MKSSDDCMLVWNPINWGHGGDNQIAKLLGLDVHTVSKGRRELFSQDIKVDRIREKGAGRKPVEKKFRRSPKG